MADPEPLRKARWYYDPYDPHMLSNARDLPPPPRTEREKGNPTGFHSREERAPTLDKDFSA